MRQYLAILLTAGFGLSVAAGMTLLSVLFGPRKRSPVKQESFECGMPPAAEPRGTARVNFYLVAMLFVMFDIEIVFIYPWAVSFGTIGRATFGAMALFIAVLFAALVYVVKKGALEWD